MGRRRPLATRAAVRELGREVGRVASVAMVVAGVGLAGAGHVDAASAAPGPTRLMIVGDSLTQETSGDYTWRYRLAQHLWLSAPGRTDLVGDRTDLWDNVAGQPGSQAYLDPWFDRDHHSAWGRNIQQEKDTIEAAVRASPTDVMLIALGANDISYLRTPQQALDDMKTLVDNARKANPNLTFVIGHVLTRWDYYNKQVVLVTQSAAFNQLLDAAVAGWSTPTSKVVTARTDEGWDPRIHTWDGSHPNPTGEIFIARAFGNALADLGLGSHYGPLAGYVPWPATGATPTATSAGSTVTLSWGANPGANTYFIEQRIVSWGETTFTRLPYPISGTTWTTGAMTPGTVVDYRVVPNKTLMTGQAGASVRVTAAA